MKPHCRPFRKRTISSSFAVPVCTHTIIHLFLCNFNGYHSSIITNTQTPPLLDARDSIGVVDSDNSSSARFTSRLYFSGGSYTNISLLIRRRRRHKGRSRIRHSTSNTLLTTTQKMSCNSASPRRPNTRGVQKH
ncbi:hypothetical protein M758_UG116200 [Ceratodon purpureus]|nr:hypothetical protein M758_UG116200 [Ceratodon purpureus]